MTKIKFENGTTVNFQGNPTSQDVEEIAQKMGIQKSTNSDSGFHSGAIDLPEIAPPEAPKSFLDNLKGGVQGVGQGLMNFFGGDKLSEGIGTALAKHGIVTGGENLSQDAKNSIQYEHTGKEYAGDTAKLGLNLASLAINPAAAFMKSTLGNIGARFGINAAQGLLTNEAQRASEGQSLVPPGGELVSTALVGGIAPELFSFLGNKIGGALKNSAEDLVSRVTGLDRGAYGTSQTKVADMVRAGEKRVQTTASKYLEDAPSFFSSAQTARTWMQKNILGQESPVIKGFDAFKNSEVGSRLVPMHDLKSAVTGVLPDIQRLAQVAPKTYGELAHQLEDARATNMTWRNVLKLKQTITNKLPEKAFNVDGASALQQGMKDLAKELNDRLGVTSKDMVLTKSGRIVSKEIAQNSGEAGQVFQDLNNKYHLYRTVYDKMAPLARNKGSALLRTAAGAGVGYFVGQNTGIGGTSGAELGAGLGLSSELGARLGTSFAGSTARAALANKSGNILSNLAKNKGAQKLGRVGLFNALSQFNSAGRNQ